MAPVDDWRHVHQLQHDRSAHEACEFGENREHRHRERRGHDARHHQEADGREAERRERVEFLVHLHRADLGGERAAAPPGEDNRRHERAEFAEKADRDEVRHVHLHAERPQRRRALEGEDETEKEADRGRDWQTVEAGPLKRESRVTEAEPARVDKHGQRVGERLAKERAVGARGRAPVADALAHGHQERTVPTVRRCRAVVGGEIVARADRCEKSLRINGLQTCGARGDMPVKRDEERLKRGRGARQRRHVKNHHITTLQAVDEAQIAPVSSNRLRIGGFDDNRPHAVTSSRERVAAPVRASSQDRVQGQQERALPPAPGTSRRPAPPAWRSSLPPPCGACQ